MQITSGTILQVKTKSEEPFDDKNLKKEVKEKTKKKKKKLRKRPNLDFLFNSDPSYHNRGFETRNYLQNENRKFENKLFERKVIENEQHMVKVEYRAGQYDDFLKQENSQQVK